MAISPQDLSVSYGGFTIADADSASYILNELDYSIDYSRLEAVIRFKVIVKGTTFALVHSRSVTLEDAFRERRNTLTISAGGDTYRTFSSSNKEIISNITLIDDDVFTSKTRRYAVTIVAGISPSEADGRTEIRVTLSVPSNFIRVLTIVTQYDSDGTDSATDNYDADIETYVTSVQTACDAAAVWRLINEDLTYDDKILDNRLTSTRVYRERIKKAEVDYGGFVVGGSSTTYDIINGWNIRVGRLEANVTFTVRVSSATIAALHTACTDLEDAFRTKRQTLDLKYDSSTYRSFIASVINVDSIGEATMLDNDFFGTPGATAGPPERLGTRDYSISITVDVPPEAEPLGRTEEIVRVSEDSSGILTVDISAQYNSIAATGAKALLDADFATYAETVRTFFGVTTWEVIRTPRKDVIPIIDNKINITATYRELNFDQATGGVRDDPDLTDFQISISIDRNFPGDYVRDQVDFGGSIVFDENNPGGLTPERLVDISVTFSTAVVKTVTDLVAKFNDDIRPYLIEIIKDRADTPNLSIHRIDPNYDQVNNRISGVINAEGAEAEGQLISASIRGTVANNFGKLIVGAHDGTAFGKFEIQAKATRRRTITETTVFLDDATVVNKVRNPPNVVGSGWITISVTETVEPRTLGNIRVDDEETMNIIETTNVEEQEWITSPVSGGAVT